LRRWRFHDLGSTRAIIWGLLLASLALVLCFIPLFNLLSFEFSFVIGLVAVFGAAHLSIGAVGDARRNACDISSMVLYARVTATALLTLVVPPLAIISLNALRVKLCDFWPGLAFYLLLPVLSVVCATAVGVAAGVVIRRFGWAMAAAVGVILASLGLSLYRFWVAPPVFAYDPFGGYFPGALYDDDVHVQAPLVWARVYHLMAVGAVLGLLELLTGRGELRLRSDRWRRRPLLLLTSAVALVATVVFYGLGPTLGYRHDATSIGRVLGGRYETDHFVIIYPLESEAARQLDLVVADHEFCYQELARTLGTEPHGRITSFVFRSASQKRELMGAARVLIAKPWRNEIYLQYEYFPHPMLKHEIAHVFASSFGSSPLKLAVRWSGPLPIIDVGLVEGVAEAAAWQGSGRLSMHQWARALDELRLAPSLHRVFGLGFLMESAPRSYTVAGSFCRFLLETYGAAPRAGVATRIGARAAERRGA
jgi:hypothetical protein